jgi:hypothetical protein
MDLCEDASNLWNFTFIQDVGGFKQLRFISRDELRIDDVATTTFDFKCYSGEPQLEKIMENGKD